MVSKPPSFKGRHHSEESKKKISLAGRGRPCSEVTRLKRSKSLLGHPVSAETRRKIGEGHKGIHYNDEMLRRFSELRRGKHQSKELIEKRRKGMRGHSVSEETRKKISDKRIQWFKDHPEDRLKISRVTRALKGEKNHNWKGGVSYKPYSVDWTKSLRCAIRERDKYICQFCGESHSDEPFNVHHIDYNKENCNPDNLITLCKACHLLTNYNREIWEEYFINKRRMRNGR